MNSLHKITINVQWFSQKCVFDHHLLVAIRSLNCKVLKNNIQNRVVVHIQNREYTAFNVKNSRRHDCVVYVEFQLNMIERNSLNLLDQLMKQRKLTIDWPSTSGSVNLPTISPSATRLPSCRKTQAFFTTGQSTKFAFLFANPMPQTPKLIPFREKIVQKCTALLNIDLKKSFILFQWRIR